MDAETFELYSRDVGAIAYAKFSGGTQRDPAMRGAQLAMTRRRRAALGATFTAVDSGRRARRRDRMEPRTRRRDRRERLAIDEAERAWPGCRDAELAYFLRVHGGSRAAIPARTPSTFARSSLLNIRRAALPVL